MGLLLLFNLLDDQSGGALVLLLFYCFIHTCPKR